MVLDDDACYRALRTHDARFDGRFFVAVRSTRIYCRPICTARPVKRENCRFYATAAEAESARYRPCLRCRPELAPGNASVDASARLAHATALAIENDTYGDGGFAEIARRLGVTDRHLRRVFGTEFGVSPVAYAQTQRLLLAKRLLTDTAMSVTDVAFASGFSSLRRFNALFVERYRLRPLQLRKKRESEPANASAGIELNIAVRPPFAWNALAAFLSSRTIDGVEEVDATSYRRTVRIVRGEKVHAGWIEIAPAEKANALRLRIASSLLDVLPAVLGKAKHLTDASSDPVAIAAVLGDLAAGEPGLRVPGAFDGFEVAVRAVLGQQITVKAARTLAARFAATFGTAVETPYPGLRLLFPSAGAIAGRSVDEIARLGIIASRVRTILALASAIADGTLSLEPGADIDATLDALRALPGIGEWTAQYVAMRALAWPDAFPHTDLGVMKALGEKNPKRVLEAGEAWRPWRAYAVMHLWRTL
jgi:AraC family transcriptional regulator of adaptative response / DNA-3-methyladenine glycosylase II